jgi:translation initiation factor eIF-2B subunit gamma
LVIAPFGAYLRRIHSPAMFLATSIDVAAGALNQNLVESGGKKKGKAVKLASPFETVGERVTVSADSRVGAGSTAGDKTSVKKSCVGHDVELGAGVKLNGCVILGGAMVGSGANLSGCIVCSNASIGDGAILKDCRVAAGVLVPEGTEATGQNFSALHEGVRLEGDEDGFDDAFEFA